MIRAGVPRTWRGGGGGGYNQEAEMKRIFLTLISRVAPCILYPYTCKPQHTGLI